MAEGSGRNFREQGLPTVRPVTQTTFKEPLFVEKCAVWLAQCNIQNRSNCNKMTSLQLRLTNLSSSKIKHYILTYLLNHW